MSINFFRKRPKIPSLRDKLVQGTTLNQTFAEQVTQTNATVTTVGPQILYRWTSPGTVGISTQLTGSTVVSTSVKYVTPFELSQPQISIGGYNYPNSGLTPVRVKSQQTTTTTINSPTTPRPAVNFQALIIAAGGGCGGDPNFSPGGGAGGMLEGPITLSPGQTFTISVSSDSTISGPFGPNITALAGGGGGQFEGGPGGSGGGAGFWGWGTYTGGTATQTPQPRPNATLTGYGNPGYGGPYPGSGMGGGGAGGGGPTTTPAKNGGAGRSNSITGSPVTYSVGGTGHNAPAPPGTYGCGGNGNVGGTRYSGEPGVIYLRY